jgi:hypothetical protein
VAGSDVPAWVALAGAGISGAAGLAGAALNAHSTRTAERDRLRQERELAGARERIKSLEKAIATASRLREEIASSLKWFEGPDGQREPPDRGLWQWNTEILHEVKGHESALKLRFDIGPVTDDWEILEWCLARAIHFCAENKPATGAENQPLPEHVRSDARDWRAWTRMELERFITDAGAAMTDSARSPTAKRFRRFRYSARASAES